MTVDLIKDIIKYCQSYEWPDWRITETLIGVLEFDPKDVEKAGYGYQHLAAKTPAFRHGDTAALKEY